MEPLRAKGISLWLMPEGESGERLAALVVRLAARLGTEPFAPHVTLLPEVLEPEAAVVARAGGLARELAPLRLKLAGVEGSDEPFRCLFVRAEASAALRAAHAAAARAFERDPDPGFLPHLSLVYGRLAPERKTSLAREVGAEAALEFEVRSLHVWRAEGALVEWRELAVFPLGAGPPQGRPTITRDTSGGSDR
jgi:2'-5' RNA ligase